LVWVFAVVKAIQRRTLGLLWFYGHNVG
jgi:hypothetical protein